MNQRDDKSSSCADEDQYLTTSALLSTASAVVAVAVSGQGALIAELAVIAAQLAIDLERQRHARRTNGNAHCAAVPEPAGLTKHHLPD